MRHVGDDRRAGTYAAVETFTGRLGAMSGTLVFMHAAATHGSDRYGELFVIAEGSGTDDLSGISGRGALTTTGTSVIV